MWCKWPEALLPGCGESDYFNIDINFCIFSPLQHCKDCSWLHFYTGSNGPLGSLVKKIRRAISFKDKRKKRVFGGWEDFLETK